MLLSLLLNEYEFEWPLTIPEGRPMLMYHPAAHRNFQASWQVAVDISDEHKCEFVHIVNDYYPWYPDDNQYPITDINGSEAWVRVGDSKKIPGRIYHMPIKGNNWMLHQDGDGYKCMEALPLVDVMYVDYWDWFEGGVPKSFGELLERCAPHIADGGLFIYDLKNDHYEGENDYHIQSESIEFLGIAEWLWGDNLAESGSRTARVYRVKNSSEKGSIDEWLSKLIFEYNLTQSQIDQLKKIKEYELRHPDSTPIKWYFEALLDSFDGIRVKPEYPKPIPAWSSSEYQKWLNTLKPVPGNVSNKRSYLIDGFEIVIINDDITDNLVEVLLENATMVLRKRLGHQCTRYFPPLEKCLLNIAIPQWSGEFATSDITSKILDLAANSAHLITIAHGQANLKQLIEDCKEWKIKNPQSILKKMTIYHLDEDDYKK